MTNMVNILLKSIKKNQIKEKLKGYFKTKNTYLVDSNVNIIHNETKTPKVIVID